MARLNGWRPPRSARRVMKEAAELAEVSQVVLFSPERRQRNRAIVIYRAAAILVLREKYDLSLNDIGRALHLDHTTVLHHLRNMCTRPAVRDVASEITHRLKR